MSKTPGKVKIFYSYSHKDEKLRDRLETSLAILKRNGLIEQWHDRRIGPGDEWDKEIREAKECYERALKIDEKAYDPDHPKVAIRVNNLGGVLFKLGDRAGAEQCAERAWKIARKVFGNDHPDTRLYKANLDFVRR